MPMNDDEVPDTSKNFFYVVKVKHAAYNGEIDEYDEYTYRMSDSVSDLPGPDTDLEFQGFSGDFEDEALDKESYVCTDVQVVDFGSRKFDDLKKRLDMKPWERKAGGV